MYYGRVYTQAFIRQLRERYPEGTRVELISMEDPYNTKLKPGDQAQSPLSMRKEQSLSIGIADRRLDSFTGMIYLGS